MIERHKVLVAKNINIDEIAGGGGSCGWNCNWGEERVHRSILPNIKPGLRVVDLGGGIGRASIPLAIKGSNITIVDRNPEILQEAEQVFAKAGLRARLEKTVVASIDKPSQLDLGNFDIVMATNALTHMHKDQGLGFVEDMPKLLKLNGGLVFVDGPSKASEEYGYLTEYGDMIGQDTFCVLCDCSGEVKEEPVPFFGPGEIEGVLAKGGGRIVFTEDVRVNQGYNFNRHIICKFS